MKNNMMTIVKKELRRVFMDKRLAFSIFIMPALAIAIVYSFMGSMLTNMMEDTQQNTPTVYAINIPNEFNDIVSDMYADTVNIKQTSHESVSEIKQQIKEGKIEMLLVFQDNFKDLLMSTAPTVERYTNSVNDYSVRAGYLMDNALEVYRQSVLAQKLGSIEAVTVFLTQSNDLAEDHEKAGKALGMLLPMLLTIFLFAGAMQVGMDTIAGEKERGTIATILMTPVKRRDIALGKMISLGIVSFISCISSLLGILASLPFSNALFAGGFDVSSIGYTLWDILGLMGIMAVLALSFVALICLASVIAKSIKEAGAYIAPMYMVVMIMSFSIMFANFKGKMWPYYIPIYGNIISIKDVITYEANLVYAITACASTLLFTMLLVFLIIRAFDSERMMKNI